jgi:hypothetical protein
MTIPIPKICMSDPRDYHLDLSNSGSGAHRNPSKRSRPYISVHFACCGVYQRIYRSLDGMRYEGHCPRCAKRVRFVVGPGGTDARTFVVH